MNKEEEKEKALRQIKIVNDIILNKYNISFSYELVIDMSIADEKQWMLRWGGREKPKISNFPNNIYILEIGIEIDDDDFIVIPKNKKYEELFNNIPISPMSIEKSNSYIIDNEIEFIEDVEFINILEEIVGSIVMMNGSIKSDNKKLRIFQWLTFIDA